MIKMKTNVTPGKTPEKITVSMIDADLKNGISKSEMTVKYGIKPWEVDEMFKHPFLKGRRPSKKKPLSFIFEDDTDEALMKKSTQELFDQIDELPDVNPNQVTLEEAIEESTKEIETAVNGLADVNKSIVDMLGPTDETPEETLLKAAVETLGDPDEDYELGKPPTFDDTLDLVKEQQDEQLDQLATEAYNRAEDQQEEEELEMDNNTFEL